MARRKTLPESVRAKLDLAERLAALRSELYGDRGGPEMARRLGIPVRTWYNYEGGVTVPAEVILKIIELTSVEAVWLLHGEGPKFRAARPERIPSSGTSSVTIGALLRTALQLLEEKNERSWQPSIEGTPEANDVIKGVSGESELQAPGVDHRSVRDLTSAATLPNDSSRGADSPRSGSPPSARIAAFPSTATQWLRSWPTARRSPMPRKKKTFSNLTASSLLPGSTINLLYAGFTSAVVMPSFVRRTRKASLNRCQSTSKTTS